MAKSDAVTTMQMPLEEQDGLLVPRQCTLTGFTEATSDLRGLHLASLSALTKLSVRTRNTNYQLTVVEPSDWKVLVKGGRFFPQETLAFLCGSGYGGTLLKVAWIGLGMRCEISNENQRVVTSPVVDFEILENAFPGPF